MNPAFAIKNPAILMVGSARELISRARLLLFMLAAVSLLLSGHVLTGGMRGLSTLVLIWCTCCGTYYIYGVNDDLVNEEKRSFDWRSLLLGSPGRTLFVLHFLILGLPVAFRHLSGTCFALLALMGMLGMAYSLWFRIGGREFRLKQLFLFKNVLIGLGWGMLVLIGAGDLGADGVLPLFAFVSLQVFIGSMIRDVPDRDYDQKRGVRTAPVVLGQAGTFVLMHLVNLTSVVLVMQWGQGSMAWLMGVAGIWRFVNLMGLQNDVDNRFWGQFFNLVTCSMVLLLTLISLHV